MPSVSHARPKASRTWRLRRATQPPAHCLLQFQEHDDGENSAGSWCKRAFGGAISSLLVQRGWQVHGLARRPVSQAGVVPVAADLQDAAATTVALKGVNPDAVFITTWLRQDSEKENIRVNSTMVRNLLEGVLRAHLHPARRSCDWPQALPRTIRILRSGRASATSSVGAGCGAG